MSETFAQRVERLKHNEKGWLFLSEADRDCIRKANQKGKVDNLTFEGEWEHNTTGFALKVVGAHEVFRIHLDYQPEPEYVDLLIEHEGLWLGVKQTEEAAPFVPFPFTHLHCLPSLPGFVGFRLQADPVIQVQYEYVARKIAEGKTVVARFRKE